MIPLWGDASPTQSIPRFGCYAKMVATSRQIRETISAVSELQGRDSRRQQILPGMRCGSFRTLSVVRQREPGECQILLGMRSQTASNRCWRSSYANNGYGHPAALADRI